MDLRPTRLLVAAGICGVALALPAAAGGHDSDAPPGARHNWLPREDWVMERWLPYEETRFYELTGTTRAEVRDWLRDDHRTLGQLARRHGVDDRALAGRLVAGWRGRVPVRQFRRLRDRARRTLTQGHVAQHMLFHLFHEVVIPRNAPAIVGVSERRYRALRRKGLTQLEIGGRAGRGEAQIRAEALRVLRVSSARGLRRSALSQEQAELDQRQQEERVSAWMRKRPAKDRPPREPPHASSASFVCRL